MRVATASFILVIRHEQQRQVCSEEKKMKILKGFERI